jgi:hypothetical protein
MKKHWLILALIFSAVVASAATPTPGHAAITTAQIATAVFAAGMQISPEQITLLTDVVATTTSPALMVESIEPWGDHRMKVRLNCAASEQCLPFFVAIRVGQDSSSQPPMTVSDHSLPGNLRAATDPRSFVIRSGAQAILMLDGVHVHIRIAVVCLENGAPGQTIRVASRDHKQTYMARVVDGAVLRASL